jgi:predicted  nucleic acid-binding Zn-ribbon protein
VFSAWPAAPAGPGEGAVGARDHLLSLLRIQELALEIARANETLEHAPQRIEQIEGQFRERNAEYVALKERHDELDADQRTRSGELTELEARRKKFMEDLMEVKTQREYAAMLKEIDSVKAQISDHEESILKDMEEIEKLKVELETNSEHIEKEREAVDKERAEVEAEAASARELIEAKGSERAGFESKLPAEMLKTLRRLEPTRQGIFLTKAENATCQSCFVRVRPQMFQEIRQAQVVHTCGNCRRFLYYEPSLKAEPEVDPAGVANDVEAVDGGAV